jgi:hypothetical protein
MGQVCYILRYYLFLYLYMVTGLYGSWGRFAIYYATVFSYIFTGLLVYMVHGAGLLYTALLSFPISLQGNWFIWFIRQVCYILRYCLFLYLYRITGLYGSLGRFAIYYATVFSYVCTWYLVCMVHGAGLLCTTRLSFPISFHDNWSIWFMGQVCYILRYCFSYIFTG